MSFERFSMQQVDWDHAKAGSVPSPQSDAIRPEIGEVRSRIAAIEQQRRHHRIPKKQWFELLTDLRTFTDQWLDISLSCGWPLLDLYGSPALIGGRVGHMGVALLLHGRSIELIDEDQIAISNRIGSPNIWRRSLNGTRAPHRMLGAMLIWDALAGDAL